jgi:hypothetical protein
VRVGLDGENDMLMKMLALALLLGATQANAAPKKHKPAPAAATTAQTDTTATTPETIDVDAMARAKDAAAGNAAAPSEAAATGESPPPVAGSDEAREPSAPAPATAPAQVPEPVPSAAPHAPAAATTAAQPVTGVPPLLSATQDPAEQRLAKACEARATSLLDAAQKGDFAGATKDFDAKMRTGLPVPKFKQAWESLAQFGALTARGQSHPAAADGYIAVTIPLLFEKANLYAQVACGSDGRVAGFYVKPLAAPKP